MLAALAADTILLQS